MGRIACWHDAHAARLYPNAVSVALGLSRDAWQVLRDRLAQGDCIAEALDDYGYHPQDVEACAGMLADGDWEGTRRDLPIRLIALVLADAVDGSVMGALANRLARDERKPSAAAAIRRAGDEAAAAVRAFAESEDCGDAIGDRFRFPDC